MKADLHHLDRILSLIADFYDECKFGYEGVEGYRKSTDLHKFIACAKELHALQLTDPERTVFLDLGCADGRVNVLMSYFVKKSIGIEIDAEILGEYPPRAREINSMLSRAGLGQLPGNISLFEGSSLDDATFQNISTSAGIRFEDVHLFYTYITLHDAFAEKISAQANNRAMYLVYGFSRILPRYHGLELAIPDVARQQIAALYKKKV